MSNRMMRGSLRRTLLTLAAILPGRRSRPSKTGRGYKALGGPRRRTRVPGIRPKLETRTGKARQAIAPPLPGTPKNTEPTDEQARQQAGWTASAGESRDMAGPYRGKGAPERTP